MRGLLLVACLVERADHVKRTFLPLIAFACEDCLAAGNRVGNGDRTARNAGESFRHREWLSEKALQASRSLDNAPVLGAELLDAKK